MTRAESKLNNIKSLALDMLDKIQTTSYVADLSYDVEELCSILDLDITFIESEIKDLKTYGYKLDKKNQEATRSYKGTEISIEKYGFDEYNINFKKGKRTGGFESNDLREANTKNRFFNQVFKEFNSKEK